MQLNSLWKRTFSYSCCFFKGGKKPQATWFSGVLRRKQLGYWIKVLVHLIKAQIVATGHSLWPTVSSWVRREQLSGCLTLPTEWLLLYFCVAKYFRAWRAAGTREEDAWLKTHIPQWPCVIQHSEAQPLPQWQCPSERKPGCKYSPRGLLTLFHYPWRGAGSCYDINCPLLTHQSSLLLPPLVLA